MKTAHAHKEVHGTVWQDKRGSPRARTAFRQPARIFPPHRANGVSKTSPRSQNPVSDTSPRVQLPLWVKPIVKAEVQRMAAMNGLSDSSQGADLLEEIIRQKLHIQQAATLETVLEKITARTHRAMATRFAWLLVRIAYDAGITRVLTTNLLGRQRDLTEKEFTAILEKAGERTKKNLMRKTPQLTELMEAVEQWLLAGEEEGNRN